MKRTSINTTDLTNKLIELESIDPSDTKVNQIISDIFEIVLTGGVSLLPGGFVLAPIIGKIFGYSKSKKVEDYLRIFFTEMKDMQIQINQLNEKLENENFMSFFEESIITASKSSSQDRREHIAQLVIHGMTNESKRIIEYSHLLYLINELNDIEIIWLQYFCNTLDQAFIKTHKNIIMPEKPTFVDRAIESSYINHLYRLNLIEVNSNIDLQSSISNGGSFSIPKPSDGNSHISDLGKLLLESIGLKEFKRKKYKKLF